MRGPELLLLDEPLAALHQELKDRVLEYLRRTLRNGASPHYLFATTNRMLNGSLTTSCWSIPVKRSARGHPIKQTRRCFSPLVLENAKAMIVAVSSHRTGGRPHHAFVAGV